MSDGSSARRVKLIMNFTMSRILFSAGTTASVPSLKSALGWSWPGPTAIPVSFIASEILILKSLVGICWNTRLRNVPRLSRNWSWGGVLRLLNQISNLCDINVRESGNCCCGTRTSRSIRGSRTSRRRGNRKWGRHGGGRLLSRSASILIGNVRKDLQNRCSISYRGNRSYRSSSGRRSRRSRRSFLQVTWRWALGSGWNIAKISTLNSIERVNREGFSTLPNINYFVNFVLVKVRNLSHAKDIGNIENILWYHLREAT